MNAIPLIGRVLFSIIFIMSGMNHFTQVGMMSGMAEGAGVPMPRVSVIVSGIVMLIGGLMVLAGYKARIGALLIFIFLILASFLVHDFWNYPQEQSMNQMINFMKNISIAGGALFIYYFGTGPMSLDKNGSEQQS